MTRTARSTRCSQIQILLQVVEAVRGLFLLLLLDLGGKVEDRAFVGVAQHCQPFGVVLFKCAAELAQVAHDFARPPKHRAEPVVRDVACIGRRRPSGVGYAVEHAPGGDGADELARVDRDAVDRQLAGDALQVQAVTNLVESTIYQLPVPGELVFSGRKKKLGMLRPGVSPDSLAAGKRLRMSGWIWCACLPAAWGCSI